MKKSAALLLFVWTMLNADYIKDSEHYTLLTPKERQYKRQLMALNAAGAFSIEQINRAIKKDGNGLSAFARAAAYDAAGDGAKAEAYADRIIKDKKVYAELKAIPDTRLFLADLYLRQGRFDEIEALLPKLEFLMWDDPRRVDRAYYYRGMAHYLKTGEFNNDYMIAAGRFDVARDIYLKAKGRIK